MPDIDINPPNIPTRNTKDFNGDNFWKRDYLERTLPVGWLDEWKKSVSMVVASAFSESKRSVRSVYPYIPIVKPKA